MHSMPAKFMTSSTPRALPCIPPTTPAYSPRESAYLFTQTALLFESLDIFGTLTEEVRVR